MRRQVNSTLWGEGQYGIINKYSSSTIASVVAVKRNPTGEKGRTDKTDRKEGVEIV